MTETVKVSKQEEILYGMYAPLVRRLGNAAAIAEEASEEAARILRESREADGATLGAKDEQGRSPHTAWLDEVFRMAFDSSQGAQNAFRRVAEQTAREVERWRRGLAREEQPQLTEQSFVQVFQEIRKAGFRDELVLAVAPDLEERAKDILWGDRPEGEPFPCGWIVQDDRVPGEWKILPAAEVSPFKAPEVTSG
jgi:hypothetical protein